MKMTLKFVSVADLPKLNNVFDEMKQVKDKIEEIARGDHKELTEDSIEESLIEMTKPMEIDISDLEVELFESAKSTEQMGVTSLLNLPDELRTTAKTVLKIGTATAEDIAQYTKRTEDAELSFAKTLVHMGYLAEHNEDGVSYFMASLCKRKKRLPDEVIDTLEKNTTDLEKAIMNLPTAKERNVVKKMMDNYLVRIRSLSRK